MERVAELLIAALDLLEAQAGRVLGSFRRTARLTALSLCFAALLLLGCALLLLGAWLLLAGPLGAGGASVLTGLFALAGATIGLLATRERKP
jgi:hypothetical protein